MTIDTWYPAILLAAGFALTILADLLAADRCEGGDTGSFWARATTRTAYIILIPLLLLYGAQTAFPIVREWVPYADRQTFWLFIPLILWAIILFITAAQGASAHHGSWLAGSIGFKPNRRWVIWCALPLILALALTWSRLGNSTFSYPAANWAATALFVLTIVRVGFSAPGAAAAVAAKAAEKAKEEDEGLLDWPSAMRERGVEVLEIDTWPADPVTPKPVDAAREWQRRLEERASPGVSPELLMAVHALVQPSASASEDQRHRLVLAPDGCGQAEVVGLAAAELARKLGESTMVITPSRRRDVLEQIARWAALAPGAERSKAVVVRELGADPASTAKESDVWIVDAEIVSDRLLGEFKQDAERIRGGESNLISRIGLVVWWDVHNYTGAPAANVWAISRRLHRLIKAHGRPGVRALALARSAGFGNAELSPFIERLLPYSFRKEQIIHVDTRMARPTRLYRITDDRRLLRSLSPTQLPDIARRLPLTAAYASAKSGWPTHLDTPPDITAAEHDAMSRHAGDETANFTEQRSDSTVSIVPLSGDNVLSLKERLSQAGRASKPGLPHFVGLLLPRNPYLEYLLDQEIFQRAATPWESSRTLIRAEGNPNIVKRHLLHALYEVEDTISGLHATLGWDRDLLEKTIRELAASDSLQKMEVVRYVRNGRLHVDRLCSSKQSPETRPRPLETVSADLVAVRHEAAGAGPGAVPLEVDAERIGIEAYPGRVFVKNGRRYRVLPWESSRREGAAADIQCETSDVYGVTFRRRIPEIVRLETVRERPNIQGSGMAARPFVADVTYRERLEGWLECAADGSLKSPQSLDRPERGRFATRALVVAFDPEPPAPALAALASILRLVLPVHMGADENSLEVVALDGSVRAERKRVHGVAIVDLYPGGIGLVEAIANDLRLLDNMLSWSHQWTRYLTQERPQALDNLRASPLVLAVEGAAQLDVDAARELLSRFARGAAGAPS